MLPGPLLSALRACKRALVTCTKNIREWTPFLSWLVLQCLRNRKRAVIICRTGALGDIICLLPMCEEILKRHPGKLVVFLTTAGYREMVMFSKLPMLVYGSKVWSYPFFIPDDFKFLGLVEKVYVPKTTDERNKTSGATCHLMDDLAGSCGITITTRQPRLFPSSDFVKKARAAYGLSEDVIGNRLIICINPGGQSWPVKEWDAAKWQKLIDKIHSSYDAIILQFGRSKLGAPDEYARLTGVQSLVDRLKPEDIVALIAASDLVITIDSGPVHVAGAVGTPVVGLYGTLNPRNYLPQSSPAIGLFSDVPCRFCHHKNPIGHWYTGCPNDICCMKQLDDETVFQAVKSSLANNPKREKENPIVISQ
jgi:ADP-heptose:LPS heptosyltransferase